jgi:hypothetical protein
VKLVMTLLVRNEADIVDAQLSFHLHAGVDFVIATDNLSDDGTTEILERYRDAGVLQLIHERGEDMRQDEWVTRMTRMAATDFGADWVINSDADEFWWPRGGSLKDVCSLMPARFGIVRGVWRHFPPLVDAGEESFSERMIVRLGRPAHPGDKTTIQHVHQKVAHRARSDVQVERGNHDVSAPGLEPLRTWHPIEVLHFSIRSVAQLEKKARGGWMRSRLEEIVDHQVRLEDAYRHGALAALLAEEGLSRDDVEHGLADGTLAVDTRLRDVLRRLRRADGRYVLPREDAALAFPAPGVDDVAAFAAEVSILASIDAVPRAEARVSALEARLAALRRLPRR